MPVTQRRTLQAAAAAGRASAEGSGGSSGAGQACDSPAAPPGAQPRRQQAQQRAARHPVGWEPLPPTALRLLGSGMLIVAIPRAEGLLQGRRAGLFKPHYKAVLRVGEHRAESDAAQASRQGAVQFSLPVALHLPAEVLEDEHAQGEAAGTCRRLSEGNGRHGCPVRLPLQVCATDEAAVAGTLPRHVNSIRPACLPEWPPTPSVLVGRALAGGSACAPGPGSGLQGRS